MEISLSAPPSAHSPAPTGPPEEGYRTKPLPRTSPQHHAKGHTPLRAAPVQTPASLVSRSSTPEMAVGLQEAFESAQGHPFPLCPGTLSPRGTPSRAAVRGRNAHLVFERLGKAVTTTILKQMAWPSIMISESYRLLSDQASKVASILETLVRSLLNREWREKL